MGLVRDVWLGALDLIAPLRCAGCDAVLPPSARSFCAACAPLVDRCDDPGMERAALVYGGPVADAIRRFKYGDRPELASMLAPFLLEAAVPLGGRVDRVVPVPLHPRRYRSRGYNPSTLLAVPVAKRLAVPLCTRRLRRVRDTPPQAGLSVQARDDNVRGAFAASRVRGERVLLIDDVRTTGVTAHACREALGAAGATEVWTLVLARVEP